MSTVQFASTSDRVIIKVLCREIHYLQDSGFGSSLTITSLITYLERCLPAVAKDIEADALWARFQQRLNEPDDHRYHIHLNSASRDLFEQCILKVLFTWGYREEYENGYSVTVDVVDDDYVVCLVNPNKELVDKEVFDWPWEAYPTVIAFETFYAA